MGRRNIFRLKGEELNILGWKGEGLNIFTLRGRELIFIGMVVMMMVMVGRRRM